MADDDEDDAIWYQVGLLSLNQDAYLVIENYEFGSILEGELLTSKPVGGRGGLVDRSQPILLTAGQWVLQAEFDEERISVGRVVLEKSSNLVQVIDQNEITYEQHEMIDLDGIGAFWHLYSSDGKAFKEYEWSNLNPLFTTTSSPTVPARPLLGEIDEEDLSESLHFVATNGGWESAGTPILAVLSNEIIGVFLT